MKKVVSILMTAAMAAALLPGIPAGAESATEGAASSGSYTPGTYSASAQGMDGEVPVTITIGDDGTITDVQVDVSGETAGIGAEIGDTVTQQILDAQSAAIDGVAGATISSTAVKEALQACLDQASGSADAPDAGAELAFTPGTYTGTAAGYNGDVTVGVTFSETNVEEIEITDSHETDHVGTAAYDIVIPDIINANGTGVDSVSGDGINRTVSRRIFKAGTRVFNSQCCRAGTGSSPTLSSFNLTGTFQDNPDFCSCRCACVFPVLLNRDIRYGFVNIENIEVENRIIPAGIFANHFGNTRVAFRCMLSSAIRPFSMDFRMIILIVNTINIRDCLVYAAFILMNVDHSGINIIIDEGSHTGSANSHCLLIEIMIILDQLTSTIEVRNFTVYIICIAFTVVINLDINRVVFKRFDLLVLVILNILRDPNRRIIFLNNFSTEYEVHTSHIVPLSADISLRPVVTVFRPRKRRTLIMTIPVIKACTQRHRNCYLYRCIVLIQYFTIIYQVEG